MLGVLLLNVLNALLVLLRQPSVSKELLAVRTSTFERETTQECPQFGLVLPIVGVVTDGTEFGVSAAQDPNHQPGVVVLVPPEQVIGPGVDGWPEFYSEGHIVRLDLAGGDRHLFSARVLELQT